jgi:hypothetical protein
MRGAYEFILCFYPAEYRASFGPEMLHVFDRAAGRPRKQGRMAALRFAGREFAGLLAGVPAQWIVKAAARSGYVTSQCAPQHESGMPLEIVETRKQIQQLIRRMEFAIAHHDFPNARRYSYEEGEAREHLNQLIEDYRRQ